MRPSGTSARTFVTLILQNFIMDHVRKIVLKKRDGEIFNAFLGSIVSVCTDVTDGFFN